MNEKYFENEDTVTICASLFQHLKNKGLETVKINQLVKDMFNIFRDGGAFTIKRINGELEEKGWEPEIVDENIVEHVLALLQKEFKYLVDSHAIH